MTQAAVGGADHGTVHGGAVVRCDAAITLDLLVVAGMDERADHRRWVERVTDRDVTHLLGEALDELVIDRILHEHRSLVQRRVEAVDHEDDGVQCSVAIGVVEDDHRVLAAEFSAPFQRRRALLDHRTGRRLADECDRLDQRVLGERRAGGLAHSVHDIEHRRQTRLEAISDRSCAV